ncbi:MAG: hypothetical protein OES47_14860 [Acidobacteriota bacterium]|nr:hypothetical protein [Acidobacteriota bacterium]
MRKALLLSLTFLLFPASSHALQFYLGAGLGSDVEGGSFRAGLEQFADSSGDSSRLFGGVRIGKHLAVEAVHYDFGSQRCCRQVADLAFTSEVDGISAAALARWPMKFATPFVKAGALSWEESGEFSTLLGVTSRTDDGVEPLYGFGIDVSLLRKIGLRLEWESYEFDGASSEGLWASVIFRIN